jgi:hypothetical protein
MRAPDRNFATIQDAGAEKVSDVRARRRSSELTPHGPTPGPSASDYVLLPLDVTKRVVQEARFTSLPLDDLAELVAAVKRCDPEWRAG